MAVCMVTIWYFCDAWLREWDSDEIHRLSDIALALSRNWQDRQKAGAFVAAAVFFVARLTSDLDEVPAA